VACLEKEEQRNMGGGRRERWRRETKNERPRRRKWRSERWRMRGGEGDRGLETEEKERNESRLKVIN
jgi:hypothetical protein